MRRGAAKIGGLIVRVVEGGGEALGCTWVSEYREKDGYGREGVGRFKCPGEGVGELGETRGRGKDEI